MTQRPARGAFAALVSLALWLPVNAAAQTIRLVPGQYPTIQAAIDAAAYNDTVKVSEGIYPENIDFHGKAIMLISEGGPAATVIDGGSRGTVVTFTTQETPMSVLEGFTIRNGLAYFGAGMTMQGASPTIVGNIFETNMQMSGGFGAAIAGNGSSPIVERNLFRDNSCDTQHLSGVVSFVNGSSPWIFNNVFVGNPCMAINMTLPVGYTPRVFNNTIAGNRGGIHVDGRIPTVQQVFRNNLIVANDVGLELVFSYGGNEPTWTNNLVYGNLADYSGIASLTGVSGNISADPLLQDLSAGDVHLLSGSPAIDAGVSTAIGFPEQDFEGDERIIDGNADLSPIVDIGADEFSGDDKFLPFAAFETKLLLVRNQGRNTDSFATSGLFRVASNGNGISPNTEKLTVRLSDADGVFFEQTLPAGALVPVSPRTFRFHASRMAGGLDRVTLRAADEPGRYSIDLAASGTDLREANRTGVTVSLQIGADAGSVTLSCRVTRGPAICR